MLIQERRARLAALAVTAFAAFAVAGTAAALPPDNNNFAAATALTGRTAFASGTNVDATKEPGEPNHAGDPGGASIWYSWTAPAAGEVTLATCESELDTLLAVYTGTAVGTLVKLESDDNGCGGDQSRLSFQASAGTVYRIAVDGAGGDTGPIELELYLAPPNDDFAAAVPLSGDTGSTGGTTENATGEPGEPEHSYGDGFPSVWFTWTAPTSGWATFQTCGFESIVAAYVGSTLSGLSEVGSDYGSCWPGSRISFETTAGTAYSVAVTGADGETGEFTLTWNRNAPPPEAPYPIDYPGISGTPVDGQTLTAVEGRWGGAQPISFAYAWGRCDRDYERCALIAGANARTYVPTAGDVGWRLYLRVAASNAVGSAAEFSDLTAVVAARPPANLVAPFVSGRATPGEILVATSGEWSGTGPMAMAYQWQSCDAAENCVDLAGEGAPVIRVTAAHLGRSLRIVVTATNIGGSGTEASDTTAVVRKKAARACVVPKVRGKTAAAARKAIRRAGCKVGAIRRSYSASTRRGRVVSQSPRAGARRAAGSKVTLVLSKGKRR